MATTFNVRYKNHCTPQEQIVSGGRYYLDSDCGRKLTGDRDAQDIGSTGNYESSKTVTATGSECEIVTSAIDYEFVFIKNTDSTVILVSLDGGSSYPILLSEREAFASEISIDTNILVKTTPSGTSTIEHYEAK